MTDDNDSADERGIFARILRKSADELEETDDGSEADVETKAEDEDDEDEMDETEQEASPIDAALEDGTISAAQASTVREVAEKMDEAGVKTLIDAISENDLDVDEAVEMIEAYNGDEEALDPEDDEDEGDNAPSELKSAAEGEGDTEAAESNGFSEEDIQELQSKLDRAEEAADKVEELEQKLEALPTADDLDEQIETKLEAVGDRLDDEFDDLIQNAEIVGSPVPTSGDGEDGTTVSESLGISGGD